MKPKLVRSLLQKIERCWHYHGPCGKMDLKSRFSRKLDCWHIKAAPVYQEVYGGDSDGCKIWPGYHFEAGIFSKIKGMWIQDQVLVSSCESCTPVAQLRLKGVYRGLDFFLDIYLEPRENSKPVEIVDTLTEEIRELE